MPSSKDERTAPDDAVVGTPDPVVSAASSPDATMTDTRRAIAAATDMDGILQHAPDSIASESREDAVTPPAELEHTVTVLLSNWEFKAAKHLGKDIPRDRLLRIADVLIDQNRIDAVVHMMKDLLGGEVPADLLVRLGSAFWREGRLPEAQGYHWKALEMLSDDQRATLRAELDREGMTDIAVRRYLDNKFSY